MKTFRKTNHGVSLLVMLLSVTFAMPQCTESAGTDESLASNNELNDSALLAQQLTDDEVHGILFMREEEKLARDVYLYLYEISQLRPFLNISKSEQAHMDAIKYLIDTYELEDPVGENPEGVFENEDLQQLYNELIEKGSTSKEEALKVGALIEEVDIIDLRTELEENAANEDVVRVFENLRNGSERHLRAFVRVLKLNEVDYRPVLLDDEEFDRILSE
ncbi:MAG: DUF2202 domain-containing protein [Bacteroidota bacterium]